MGPVGIAVTPGAIADIAQYDTKLADTTPDGADLTSAI